MKEHGRIGEVVREVSTQELLNRRDYSKRHRKAEWRSNWLHLHRSSEDNELVRIRKIESIKL